MKIHCRICALPGRITAQRVFEQAKARIDSQVSLRYDGGSVSHSARLGPKAHWRHTLGNMVFDQPPGHLRNDDAILLIEDDVAIARGLGDWLKRNLYPDNVNAIGVISLYTASTVDKKPGWNVMPHIEHPYAADLGACALLFPVKSAAEYLLDPNDDWHRNTGQGASVLKWCQRTGKKWYFHSPSFIQHIGIESTLGLPYTENRYADDFVEECPSD